MYFDCKLLMVRNGNPVPPMLSAASGITTVRTSDRTVPAVLESVGSRPRTFGSRATFEDFNHGTHGSHGRKSGLAVSHVWTFVLRPLNDGNRRDCLDSVTSWMIGGRQESTQYFRVFRG